MKHKKSIPKEYLSEVVSRSKTYASVCRVLGLKVHGGNYRTIKRLIDKYEISIAHFEQPAPKAKFKAIPLDEILIENSAYKGGAGEVKKKLIKAGLIEDKCIFEDCPTNVYGLRVWRGKEIKFQLDHINGVNNDYRFENLRVLCPICHTQTDTYVGKNKKRKQYSCLDCGCPVFKTSKRCRNCAKKYMYENGQYKTVIDWPDHLTLKEMVEKTSYSEVGRRLGVSDNAVKKRLKKFDGG